MPRPTPLPQLLQRAKVAAGIDSLGGRNVHELLDWLDRDFGEGGGVPGSISAPQIRAVAQAGEGLRRLGKAPIARALIQWAVRADEELHGEDSIESTTAVVLTALGGLLADKGELDAAEGALRRALVIHDVMAEGAARHIDIAATLAHLGSVARMKGKAGEAVALLSHAMDLHQSCPPTPNADLPSPNRRRVGGGGDPGWVRPENLKEKGPCEQHACSRAPMAECTAEEFLNDVRDFWSGGAAAAGKGKRKKTPAPKMPPLPNLNGSPLDLFVLYREVSQRGGIHCADGINWKGQVFNKMSNFTPGNRQTAVGNALRKHYEKLLLPYELAHVKDIDMDVCVICKGGAEKGSDWVCCAACEDWCHFECDDRRDKGSFKEYAKDGGPDYYCSNPGCSPSARRPRQT